MEGPWNQKIIGSVLENMLVELDLGWFARNEIYFNLVMHKTEAKSIILFTLSATNSIYFSSIYLE